MATLDLRPLSLGELLDRTFFLVPAAFPLVRGHRRNSIFHFLRRSTDDFTASPIGPVRRVRPGAACEGLPRLPLAGASWGLSRSSLESWHFFFQLAQRFLPYPKFTQGAQTTIRQSLRQVRGEAGTIFGVLFLSGLIYDWRFHSAHHSRILFNVPHLRGHAGRAAGEHWPSDSIRRSFELTKGFAGRAFMIYLLYFAMAWGIIAVFQMPFIVLIAFYAKQTQMLVIWTVFMQVGSFIGSSLVAPVSTIGFALFYYDLRVRKEAFDLQIMMQAIGADPAPSAGYRWRALHVWKRCDLNDSLASIPCRPRALSSRVEV